MHVRSATEHGRKCEIDGHIVLNVISPNFAVCCISEVINISRPELNLSIHVVTESDMGMKF